MNIQQSAPSESPDSVTESQDDQQRLIVFHLRVGWWSLLIFLTLGLILEGMHGLKVGWYLDVSNDVRRLMWTLAHAHGTLLALLHMAFAATVAICPGGNGVSRKLASRCLLAAGALVPLGFFLGGTVIHGGDPSVGILLVPVGAVLLFASVLMTARSLDKTNS
ncbi:MAG: hypothetical protein IID46_00750 [Planctomycetes bacterium]|nr:hypothetical protein [Planctomycetota bacterium]